MEKAFWDEEHESCRRCDYDNNSDPEARCNGCINGGDKETFFKEITQKKDAFYPFT